MEPFVVRHRALLIKHARAYVQANAEKITPENVAKELELILVQLQGTGLDLEKVPPDRYLRTVVKYAVGRAKRRATLIKQVAAGDDLRAVSEDLAALDADLPPLPNGTDDTDLASARATLDKVQGALAPRDRLIFALLIEDALPEARAAAAISRPAEEIRAARARILEAATKAEVEPMLADRRLPADPEARREAKLLALASFTGSICQPEGHVAEPLLTLLRDGDLSDDLADAMLHVAVCADCRARLTEGAQERRSVVVMAIEAPGATERDLAPMTEESGALLLERGLGRFTALVDADRADRLKGKLETSEDSMVARLAVATPVEVTLDDEARGSGPEFKAAGGTDAAEVSAWAQIYKKAPRATPKLHPGWALFAVGAVTLAVAVAYFLAMR